MKEITFINAYFYKQNLHEECMSTFALVRNLCMCLKTSLTGS